MPPTHLFGFHPFAYHYICSVARIRGYQRGGLEKLPATAAAVSAIRHSR
eukprot:CAMPEP_0177782966 /NCGR_PEP_ID=MMETSP0491_2-20121128/18813_1 /TAXON_ID=63592 /ORGANISM="Tetraselmis chuii, Strain PLY429" /LENGTH=48 /DNA_ID= /DNA_START= /DNA_END= /DNA_ORIENTATION=